MLLFAASPSDCTLYTAVYACSLRMRFRKAEERQGRVLLTAADSCRSDSKSCLIRESRSDLVVLDVRDRVSHTRLHFRMLLAVQCSALLSPDCGPRGDSSGDRRLPTSALAHLRHRPGRKSGLHSARSCPLIEHSEQMPRTLFSTDRPVLGCGVRLAANVLTHNRTHYCPRSGQRWLADGDTDAT